MPPAAALEATVALSGALTPVEPQLVHVIDATRPDGNVPPPVVIASSDHGVLTVIDVRARTVRLISESSGGPITEHGFEPPPLDSPAFYFGALRGPDDVLYLLEGEGSNNRVAAYGLTDGVYRFVAASDWWESPADGQGYIVLGTAGPAYAPSMTEPLLEYVDRSGAQSGVTLPVEPIVARFFTDGETHELERGNASWRIMMTVFVVDGRGGLAGVCPGCVVTVGPPHSVLVVDQRGHGQDTGSVVAVLTPDDVTVHRFLWSYVGATVDSLVFSRYTERGLEIGMFRL